MALGNQRIEANPPHALGKIQLYRFATCLVSMEIGDTRDILKRSSTALDGLSTTTLAFILAFIALAVVWKALDVLDERSHSTRRDNDHDK